MIVNITGGTLSETEISAYQKRGEEKYGSRHIVEMDINVDGEYVDVKYLFEEVPFERVRRITGYLVGTLDRFNDAKRAEESQRVKHNIA